MTLKTWSGRHGLLQPVSQALDLTFARARSIDDHPVARNCPSPGESPGRELHCGTRAPHPGRDLAGLEVPHAAHGGAMLVQEECVDGELHPDHVDLPAAWEHQRLLGRHRFAPSRPRRRSLCLSAKRTSVARAVPRVMFRRTTRSGALIGADHVSYTHLRA